MSGGVGVGELTNRPNTICQNYQFFKVVNHMFFLYTVYGKKHLLNNHFMKEFAKNQITSNIIDVFMPKKSFDFFSLYIKFC